MGQTDEGHLPTYEVLTWLAVHVFQGPRCPAKCRDLTTAPAQAGEARISNKGKRYHLNRSGSKHSPKRRKPRSRVKPLLNFLLVPRGKLREGKKPAWIWVCRAAFTQALFVKLKASPPPVPEGVKLYKKTPVPQALSFQTSVRFSVTLNPQKKKVTWYRNVTAVI